MHPVEVLCQIGLLELARHRTGAQSMQLNTILNQVTDYKSFRFGRGHFVTDRQGGKAIEVPVYPARMAGSCAANAVDQPPNTIGSQSVAGLLCHCGKLP